MNEPLVSVIVPVYNVEQYLDECINSLINQTYKNLEIIIVDDGSIDNSGKICDSYDDLRIKVYHKTNGGLSDARNYGLKFASGDYILFVDSDDFLDTNMIKTLVENAINYDVDISICGYSKYYNKDNIVKCTQCLFNEKIIDLKRVEYLYDFNHYGVGVWNKLLKKELLEDILFPVGKVSEDYFVMYKIFYKTKSIYYTNESLYFYRQRQNSITKSKKTRFDVLDALEQYVEFAKNIEPSLLDSAIHALVFSQLGVYNTILNNRDALDKKKELKQSINKNYKIAYKYEECKNRKAQLFIFRYFNLVYPIFYRAYMRKR